MNTNSLDAQKMTEELKKAVKATLLLMYPDKVTLISGGSLTLTALEPEGTSIRLVVNAQMLSRTKPPTEK